MQEKMNEEIINSEIGDMPELIKKAQKNMASGKTNNFTIASFCEGETIEIKGLKFKIRSINQQKKKMLIKML